MISLPAARSLALGLLLFSSLGACSAPVEEDDSDVSGSAVRQKRTPPDLQEQTLALVPNESAEIWFTAVTTEIAALEFRGSPNLEARVDLHAQGMTEIAGTGAVFLDLCPGQTCLKNGTLAQDSRPYMVGVRNTGSTAITVIRRILPVAAGAMEETDQTSVCRTSANGPGSACSRKCGPNKAAASGVCFASRESLTLPKAETVVGHCNAVCR